MGGDGLCCNAPWPEADPDLLVDDTIILPIQVNGKKRSEISIPADMSKADIEALAMADEKAQSYIEGKNRPQGNRCSRPHYQYSGRMMRALFLSFTLMLGLSACGFTPLHATGGGASVKNVRVEAVQDDEISFLLKQSLRDRISGASPQYTLVLTPKLSRSSLGISADDVASRYDLNLRVDYQLRENKSGKVLMTDRVSAVSTFGGTARSLWAHGCRVGRR